MATLRAADPSFVESVRLRYFDSLVMSKPAVNDQITDSIVVANVDEATLDKRGQWPFKRGTYAEMMQELFDKGAKLVVWNVLDRKSTRLNSSH